MIKRIEAINKNGKKYIWSADILFWNELPRWLVENIKNNFKQIKIN